jgi:hypothetical protein
MAANRHIPLRALAWSGLLLIQAFAPAASVPRTVPLSCVPPK